MWGRRTDAARLATVLQAHDDEDVRDPDQVRAAYLSVLRRKPDRIACFAAGRLAELDGEVAGEDVERVSHQYLRAASMAEDELADRAACALADLMTRVGKPGMAAGPLRHVIRRAGPRAAWALDRLTALEAVPLTHHPTSGEPMCSLCRGTAGQVGPLHHGERAHICAACAGVAAEAARDRTPTPELDGSTRACSFCGQTRPASDGMATPFTLAWICYPCGADAAAHFTD